MAVATFISTVAPVKIAVVVVAVFSVLSWAVECWTVKKVWNQNGRLRASKENLESEMGRMSLDFQVETDLTKYSNGTPSGQMRLFESDLVRNFFAYTKETYSSHKEGIQYYFSSSVWIPSLCVAILHASVLSWSATLFTYLLNAGFSLGLITVARAIGSFFEISSTFIFPWAVRALLGGSDKAAAHGLLNLRYMDTDEHPDAPLANSSQELAAEAKDSEQAIHNLNTGVVRVGRWGIYGLVIALVYRMG